MENNNQNTEDQESVKISKKSLYIGVGVVALLVLIGLYFFFSNEKEPAPATPPKTDSTAVKTDSQNVAKKDSLSVDYEGEYEEYEPYSSYKVIANSINLPNGQKLNFGDEVWVNNSRQSESDKIIYLNDPYKVPSTKSFPITINSDLIIDSYQFTNFKNTFSLPPYNGLPVNIKKALNQYNDKYVDGYTYRITQSAERAKNTLATGDFNGDGTKETAVILDDNERQASHLVIMSINKVTKEAFVEFGESYVDKFKVRAFTKGASIYMDSPDFVKAPLDGLILAGESGTWAVVYDKNTQKYKLYSQVPTEAPSATAVDYIEE